MPGFFLKQSGSVYGSGTPGVGGGAGIIQRILNVAPSNLVALWPLNELAGSTVNCTNNAALSVASGHVGVTLAQSGPYGEVCPLYDGLNDRSSIYSAAMAAAVNTQEGTAIVAAKVANSGVWGDLTTRYLFHIYSAATNYIAIVKSSTVNRISFLYNAAGTTEIVNLTTTNIGWNLYTITWSLSGDAVKAYVNGTQTGVTQNGLGIFAGALSNTGCVVGAANLTPSSVFNGWLSLMTLYNRPLTPTEIAFVYGGSI